MVLGNEPENASLTDGLISIIDICNFERRTTANGDKAYAEEEGRGECYVVFSSIPLISLISRYQRISNVV